MKVFRVAAVVLATHISAGHAQPAATPVQADVADSAPNSRALEAVMALQQTHHLKLWFAGLQNYWELADYEFDKLKRGLDDTAKLYPTFNNAPVGQIVDSMNSHELLDLANTIAARDREKFISAFDRVTAACNGCHRAADRGFIVMRRPASSPYSNQLLTPAQPR